MAHRVLNSNLMNYETDFQQATIFIIDDDPMIRRILAASLNNYDLMSFSEGQFAIKHLQENPDLELDLAISDFGMPNSNGTETLKQIRKLAPSTKLMLISGSLSEDLQKICLENQFDHYLNKPFLIQELQAIVKELVSHENRESSLSSLEKAYLKSVEALVS